MNNPQNYTNHQLNSSKSKAAFLFPKQKRFNCRTKFLTQSFYDIPSTKDNRTTSFGYGKKSTFFAKSKSPPPGTYEIKSGLQKSNQISFGKGRQNVQFGSFLASTEQKKYIPSPNKYSISVPLSKISGKILSKLPTELDKIKSNNTPGPGTYNIKGFYLAQSGCYFLSQFKNSRSPSLHTVNSVSMYRKRSISEVSPTSYNTLQKERGKYYNSKHRNTFVGTFTKQKRDKPQSRSKKVFPGFRYKRFSQFGSFI